MFSLISLYYIEFKIMRRVDILLKTELVISFDLHSTAL